MAEIYYVPRLMPYPLIELGGHGPPVVLVPANGFPPGTYVPALEPLLKTHRVVSLPQRALWEDAGPVPEKPGSWVSLAEDLLEGMRRHGLPRSIVVGHSFGAIAALLAAVREPARFRGLALLDPTIFPPAIVEQFEQERRRGEASSRPLVQGARARRDRFSSEEEAFAYWHGKPLFADWPDDSLRRYTRAMLRPADGGGLKLAWPPAWEAHYYESIYTESWAELERLDPGIPLLVVRGERSDTFLPEAAELFAAAAPWAELRVIRGRGHLFPQSEPGETGRVLREWVDG